MKAIELDILPAWVHEDDLLFILGKVWPMKRVEEANDALERHGYDERLTWLDMPLSRRHTVLWVDPAYLAAERWPESAVSLTEVEGWEQVFRVEVSDLTEWRPVETEGDNRV